MNHAHQQGFGGGAYPQGYVVPGQTQQAVSGFPCAPESVPRGFKPLGRQIADVAFLGDTVYAVNANGKLYRLDPDADQWRPVPTPPQVHMTQVSADSTSSTLWLLDATGRIFRFIVKSSQWTSIPGTLCRISAGSPQNVWGLASNHHVFRLDPDPARWGWIEIPGQAVEVSVSPTGRVVVVGVNGAIFEFEESGQTWKGLPGRAKNVCVGDRNQLWCVGEDGVWYEFEARTGQWSVTDPELQGNKWRKIVVKGNSVAGIGLADERSIYVRRVPAQLQQQFQPQPQPQPIPVAVAVPTAPSPPHPRPQPAGPKVFKQLTGQCVSLTIGQSREVFAVTGANAVVYALQEGPGPQWKPFQSGANLVAISCGADGEMWGIDGMQSVFRKPVNAPQFVQVGGQLAKICCGAQGVVVGVTPMNQAYQWIPQSEGWSQLPGAVQQIVADATGKIYALGTDKKIYALVKVGQWSPLPGAADMIAVAKSDRSLWALSAGSIYVFRGQSWVDMSHKMKIPPQVLAPMIVQFAVFSEDFACLVTVQQHIFLLGEQRVAIPPAPQPQVQPQIQPQIQPQVQLPIQRQVPPQVPAVQVPPMTQPQIPQHTVEVQVQQDITFTSQPSQDGLPTGMETPVLADYVAEPVIPHVTIASGVIPPCDQEMTPQHSPMVALPDPVTQDVVPPTASPQPATMGVSVMDVGQGGVTSLAPDAAPQVDAMTAMPPDAMNPAVAEMSGIPDVSSPPEGVPEMPQAAELHGMPEQVASSEMPGMTEQLSSTEMPGIGMSETASSSEMPGMPETASSSEMPGMPDAATSMEMPGMPETSASMEMPGMTEAVASSEMPRMPETEMLGMSTGIPETEMPGMPEMSMGMPAVSTDMPMPEPSATEMPHIPVASEMTSMPVDDPFPPPPTEDSAVAYPSMDMPSASEPPKYSVPEGEIDDDI